MILKEISFIFSHLKSLICLYIPTFLL